MSDKQLAAWNSTIGATITSVEVTAVNHVKVELNDGRTLVVDAETYGGIPHIEVSVKDGKRINPRVAAFTDDLAPGQFQELITWLMEGHHVMTPANIKSWRRKQGLPIERED